MKCHQFEGLQKLKVVEKPYVVELSLALNLTFWFHTMASRVCQAIAIISSPIFQTRRSFPAFKLN